MSRWVVAIVALALLPTMLSACLWDHDTLAMERQRFPSVLELITGKFLRHSPEFYVWRVEDRKRRLEQDPNNLALLDDLGVAYDKLGQHDLALATVKRAEMLNEGRYETLANRATFEFHAGRLKEGMPYLDKALQINPAAHFNRERYQGYVVDLILTRGQQLPLGVSSERLRTPEALQGLLGMMKLCAGHVVYEEVEVLRGPW
jgi:tetratricopeptide (TPR) repeat protein